MQLESPDHPDGLPPALERSGYALLLPCVTRSLTGLDADGWRELRAFWEDLPRDPYLKDGGRYRARRHASLVQDLRDGSLVLAPHRAHWQPTEYNALHGGMRRWFEPVAEDFLGDARVRRCLAAIGERAARLRDVTRWFIELHQVRIDTAGGIGRPTPEGAHRDGVDFVAVWLAGRESVLAGETRVFEADGPRGVRFTMLEPGSALVLDDARVIHETTPIQPAESAGCRDTLVVTYRAGGFMEPEEPPPAGPA
jgi:hypothetical protein